jgi:hypothetical protein
MVGGARETLEFPGQQPVRLGAECVDHPLSLISVDLGRGEGLAAALVAQPAASRCSEVANPVGQTVLGQEIGRPVDLPPGERDLDRPARASAGDLEYVCKPGPQQDAAEDATPKRDRPALPESRLGDLRSCAPARILGPR